MSRGFKNHLNLLLLSLCLQFAVSVPVRNNVLEVKSVVGESPVLQCTAEYTPGVQYMSLRWYKVLDRPSVDSRLSGLLTRDLPNGSVRWYSGSHRQGQLIGQSRDILLSNVTCGDRGMYECHLSAPVGQQNREGKVLLTLTDCPETPDSVEEETLEQDAFMVIIAVAVLTLALVTFCVSYFSLKNLLKDRNKTLRATERAETLLDAPPKPLEKRDLMLIYTLGPKVSKKPTYEHVCV